MYTHVHNGISVHADMFFFHGDVPQGAFGGFVALANPWFLNKGPAQFITLGLAGLISSETTEPLVFCVPVQGLLACLAPPVMVLLM